MKNGNARAKPHSLFLKPLFSNEEPPREEIKEVNEIITQVFQLAEGIPAEEIEENIERMVKETVNVFRDILDLAV